MVGKTCLLYRYCEDEFHETITTVGIDFKVKVLDNYNGEKVRVTIWDTGTKCIKSLLVLLDMKR